jgi:hypothetical protein
VEVFLIVNCHTHILRTPDARPCQGYARWT